MTLTLNEQQTNVLKALLVQLMANQVNNNAQSIVNTNQNCIFFLTEIEKSAQTDSQKEKPGEQEPAL